jgi:protocatechuate 4,5-dioxygenase beta chain
MAILLAGLGTSHVPVIGRTINAGAQKEADFKPFFDAYDSQVRPWIEDQRPTVAIIVYNDHGLNFFLDAMPSFAIGVAHEYHTADEGFGEPRPRCFQGNADLGWHIAQSLIEEDFDMTICREIAVDHALTTPLDLIWGAHCQPNIAIIPLFINAIQPPFPRPARCYALGEALGRAVRSYAGDARVMVIGSGGLSHELGVMGKINESFDLMCMDKIVVEPEALYRYTNDEIVDQAGAQGLELMTWLVMRGALAAPRVACSIYHAPISHTGGAMMLLEDPL